MTLSRPDPKPGRLFIDGQWREAADGGRLDVLDPSTGQVVTTVAAGTAKDIDDAVTAARSAFPAWRDTHARERGRVLQRVAALMRERADEIAATTPYGSRRV